VGGLTAAAGFALIALAHGVAAAPLADPLTQALILTAIVISFGVQAFAMVLIKRAYDTVGADDPYEMKTTDT
jgi:multicomponent Na+:H+ antiporter subunit C